MEVRYPVWHLSQMLFCLYWPQRLKKLPQNEAVWVTDLHRLFLPLLCPLSGSSHVLSSDRDFSAPIPQLLQGVSKALNQSVSCHCWEQVATYPFGQLCHQTINTPRDKRHCCLPLVPDSPLCKSKNQSSCRHAFRASSQSCRWGMCIYVSVALLLTGLHLLLA